MADVVHMKRKRGRPPKHGAYSPEALEPITRQKLQLIEDILRGDKPEAIIGKTDRIAVGLLARTLARIELIDRWSSAHDMLASDSKDILRVYMTLLNTALKICHELGMTSTSRFRIGVDVAKTKDMATELLEARVEEEEEHARKQLTMPKENTHESST